MRIGILSKNYAATRLFLNKIEGAQYKDLRFLNYFLWRNAHLWFLRAIGKLRMTPEEQASKLFYKFKALMPTGCDVYHFFNCINYSRKQPWVISVESAVPWPLEVIRCVESPDADLSTLRGNKEIERELALLAMPNCRGLMTLSKCSERIQLELLKQFPLYEKQIRAKLLTIYPQQILTQTLKEKNVRYGKGTELTFIYVGTDFFRKGGRETVEVLSELHDQYKFKLILISSLRVDEPKYMMSANEVEETRRSILSADWIEYHNGLDNATTLKKIKQSHVALLPTWMDTFAYSVLECQASGTPVISTSLRALTEINDDSVGWLVKVPVNKLNNPIHNTPDERKLFSAMLKKGLRETVVNVLEHPEEIEQKALSGLERIKKYHNPEEYARKLRCAYKGHLLEI